MLWQPVICWFISPEVFPYCIYSFSISIRKYLWRNKPTITDCPGILKQLSLILVHLYILTKILNQFYQALLLTSEHGRVTEPYLQKGASTERSLAEGKTVGWWDATLSVTEWGRRASSGSLSKGGTMRRQCLGCWQNWRKRNVVIP